MDNYEYSDLPDVLCDIINEYSIEPWCGRNAEWLARIASPFSIAASVGMLGRFWRPREGEVQEAVEKAVAGTSPGYVAKEWWNSLPQETKRQVVDTAFMRVDDLLDELPCLGEKLDAQALHFLWNRDTIESVRFLLNGTPEAETLREALRGLDREAAPLYAAWAPELKDDDHLCAVASEPGAWWPKGVE